MRQFELKCDGPGCQKRGSLAFSSQQLPGWIHNFDIVSENPERRVITLLPDKQYDFCCPKCCIAFVLHWADEKNWSSTQAE